MLTPEGLALLWAIASGSTDDSLRGGSVVVSDGERRASATFDGEPEVTATDVGARWVVNVTFGEDAANFEWRSREVRSAQGVVVDRADEDLGRKVAGAVWSFGVELELGGA